MHVINLRLVVDAGVDADDILSVLTSSMGGILGSTELEEDRFGRLQPTLPFPYTRDRALISDVVWHLNRGHGQPPPPPTPRESSE